MLKNSYLRRVGFVLLIPTFLSMGDLPILAEPLTAAMEAEMGAATWIPEDAGYFAASYRYREQWTAFTQTKTYQELLTMPVVQMGLGWLRQQPYLDQLAAMRAQNPLLDDGLNVLQDAFSEEVFLYVDSRGPGFINELGGLYNSLLLSGFMQGFDESTDMFPEYSQRANKIRLLQQVVAAQQDLRLPGLVLGFRLSNPQAGREWLADLKPVLQQAVPLPMQDESYGAGEYLTLTLRAEMFLTPQIQDELEEELGLAEVDAVTAEQFIRFIRSQTLAISLGMRGDYLMISLGADNSHLANLGTARALAGGDAFEPVRRYFRERLIGLIFTHPDLTRYGKMDVDGIVAGLRELAQQAEPHLPSGFAERAITDVRDLLQEINTSLPVAQPRIKASFWQDGIESFTFTALMPNSMDSSEPLSILAHAGASPLLAVAGHAQPSLENYERLVFWVSEFYSYFEDYAVPNIPQDELAKFREFEALAIPALQRIDATTRELLIPSLDGGQSLFVLDADGLFNRSPETKDILPRPLRFPRPTIVAELNDHEKFVSAWSQYRNTFNTLMEKVAASSPEVSEFQLPAPIARQVEEATLYTYPIPASYNPATYLDDDFEPHVLVARNHFVFSLSPKYSRSVLTKSPLSTGGRVDLGLPAGRAVWFDALALTDLICDDAEAVVDIIDQEKGLDANIRVMIQIHVDKLRKALSAVRSYRSRTYEQQGLSVTHGWLHLQDIE